ncbi:hypothetical protein [Breoghania sp. L-A4]|uniref:hypothetical protein n=1 Tax=Breoghania sp. L-A4 TaxID=2304600 RepID=UPI0013C312E1|nr:hypothetical protein [Breoghania sp. L-A4]
MGIEFMASEYGSKYEDSFAPRLRDYIRYSKYALIVLCIVLLMTVMAVGIFFSIPCANDDLSPNAKIFRCDVALTVFDRIPENRGRVADMFISRAFAELEIGRGEDARRDLLKALKYLGVRPSSTGFRAGGRLSKRTFRLFVWGSGLDPSSTAAAAWTGALSDLQFGTKENREKEKEKARAVWSEVKRELLKEPVDGSE